MLKADSNCVKTFTFKTPWSVPLVRVSNVIKYWTLRLSMENGRKVAPSVLESVRASADIQGYTSTREHIMVERNLARITLRALIKTAEETRASELRKRAEKVATDGNVPTIRSYETLIEHKKSKAQWRKIKYYLNKGDI